MNPYAQQSQASYLEQQVLTASRGQLVVLLYDGIVRFLRQADVAMGEGAWSHANDRIGRAEAIINELQATLDMRQGRIAENLEGIYVFWKKCLWEIRLEKDREKLARVVKMVGSLRDAWAQIAQSTATSVCSSVSSRSKTTGARSTGTMRSASTSIGTSVSRSNRRRSRVRRSSMSMHA